MSSEGLEERDDEVDGGLERLLVRLEERFCCGGDGGFVIEEERELAVEVEIVGF